MPPGRKSISFLKAAKDDKLHHLKIETSWKSSSIRNLFFYSSMKKKSSKNSGIGFLCRECGYESVKWFGKCPECGNWGCMTEIARSASRTVLSSFSNQSPEAVSICDISSEKQQRISTGIGEFDRVLGGGIVPGSLVLIAGDPGIGKSTLLLQALSRISKRGKSVLYVSGEESVDQIKLRADRLGIKERKLKVATETNLESMLNLLESIRPLVLVIDSVQTVQTSSVGSPPGSVSQIRESANILLTIAKATEIAIMLAGHVTKEGMIAGPRILEHLVDAALYFEGSGGQNFRILRAVKNRFGATNEIGVFEMSDRGLIEVTNPSAIFISERPENISGSVVMASIEGTRPILVEIQCLVTPTTFPQPRRMTMGIDGNRLALLTAILEKKMGISFSGNDIFINVAGGVKIIEPAIDLPVVMALVSCYFDKPLPPDAVIFGEVGLVGEVRGVDRAETRVSEASKLGFKKVIMPAPNLQAVPPACKIEAKGVSSLVEAIRSCDTFTAK